MENNKCIQSRVEKINSIEKDQIETMTSFLDGWYEIIQTLLHADDIVKNKLEQRFENLKQILSAGDFNDSENFDKCTAILNEIENLGLTDQIVAGSLIRMRKGLRSLQELKGL
jgi:hypothetical protein